MHIVHEDNLSGAWHRITLACMRPYMEWIWSHYHILSQVSYESNAMWAIGLGPWHQWPHSFGTYFFQVFFQLIYVWSKYIEDVSSHNDLVV